MNRRSYLKSTLAIGATAILPAGIFGLVGRSATSSLPALEGFNGTIMGTNYSVRLGSKQLPEQLRSDQAIRALSQKVHTQLQDVDAHMSTWRADSELSVFNNSMDTDWQSITPATTSVIAQAYQTSELSRGAFDVSVGPVVDLWGFGAGAAESNVKTGFTKPSSLAVRETLKRVGYESLDVDVADNRIRKLIPELQLDLSGIAKGYAVDAVAAMLVSEGVDSFLIDIGGELKSSGLKPNGTAWKVAIERPNVGQRSVFRILKLDKKAVATSGNYRNFFIDGGQRYSHSIDPRTGQCASNELASVTVVANTTMKADALSTAMMIMGPDDAMAYATQYNLAVHLILKSGKALKEVYSPALTPLLV